MVRRLESLVVLATLVAACSTDSPLVTGPGPFANEPAAPPSVSATITMTPSLAIAGNEVTFTERGLFDSDAYSRTWEFGDGSTAEGPTVTHVFVSAGAYGVTVVGSDGLATRTASMTANVAEANAGNRPPPEWARRP